MGEIQDELVRYKKFVMLDS